MNIITKDISNQELIQLLQQKQMNAYEFLYDTYAPMLYGVICKLVKDDALAEEVLKKSFIQIWNDLSTRNFAKCNLFIWMHNITRNIAMEAISGEISNNPMSNQQKSRYKPAKLSGFGSIMLS